MFTYTASGAPGASQHAKVSSASILRERERRVPSEVLILIALLDGKDDWKGLSTKYEKQSQMNGRMMELVLRTNPEMRWTVPEGGDVEIKGWMGLEYKADREI